MNPLCYKIFISSPKEQNAVQSVWCHLPWSPSLQCWTTPLYFVSCLCVFVYFCEFWFPPGLFLFWRWWFPTFSISNAAIKLWLQLAAWLLPLFLMFFPQLDFVVFIQSQRWSASWPSLSRWISLLENGLVAQFCAEILMLTDLQLWLCVFSLLCLLCK